MAEHREKPSASAGQSACGCSGGHDCCGGKEAGKERGGDAAMPVVSFSTFVLSLASSALVQLGEVPDPATGARSENIPLAKHTIDLISMLQDKTRNGLDAEETRLLEGLLYELRMKYVAKK